MASGWTYFQHSLWSDSRRSTCGPRCQWLNLQHMQTVTLNSVAATTLLNDSLSLPSHATPLGAIIQSTSQRVLYAAQWFQHIQIHPVARSQFVSTMRIVTVSSKICDMNCMMSRLVCRWFNGRVPTEDASFFFHSCTVHIDIIESFIYPTDAQLDCSKNVKIYIKIYMRGAPTCFGFPQPSSGSYYMCFAKVISINNQLKYVVYRIS